MIFSMNGYADKLLRDDRWILEKLTDENCAQLLKWGVQTKSSYEWLACLTEELGELAEAILEHEHRNGTTNHVVAEAIQVATLALKIAEMYDDS